MFAALRNLVARDAPPYDVGESVPYDDMWTLAPGTAKADNATVSIFSHDKRASTEEKIGWAKNTIKRLRGLRHPNILKFIDTFETDTHVHLVTEPVKPLEKTENPADPKQLFAIQWGLLHMLKVVSFLHDSHLAHRGLHMRAVLVDRAGEWKLGAVDWLGSDKDPIPTRPERYVPPEKDATSAQPWAQDMWGLGIVVWEVFNGPLTRAAQLTQTGAVPKPLLPQYVQLVSASAKSRPNPTVLLNDMRNPGKFLHSAAIDACLFLETLAVADKDEAAACYAKLPQLLDGLPDAFCRHRLLPVLLGAFNFNSAGSNVLTPLLKIGKLLDTAEYQAQIVPCLVKLFSSPDRATRISLLQQLDQFIPYLSTDVVTTDIFPHVVHGFADTVPAVREQTVKSMLLIVPKLHAPAIDAVLRHFAKLQVDEQPSIRTNTTICLGKLAQSIPVAARDRVLIPAFLRATKDPFTHARIAGLMAVGATLSLFTAADCATRIFPAITPLCIDPEPPVRDQSFVVCRALLTRLEAAAKGEDTPPPAEEKKEAAAGVATWATWAGSAMSVVSSKLYKSASADPSAASTSEPPSATATVPPTSLPAPGPAASAASSSTTSARNQSSAAAAAKREDSDNDEDNDGWSDHDDGWSTTTLNTKAAPKPAAPATTAIPIKPTTTASPALPSPSLSSPALSPAAGETRDLKGAARPARLGAMRLGEKKAPATSTVSAPAPAPAPVATSTPAPVASTPAPASKAEADGWDVGDWSVDYSPPKAAAVRAPVAPAPAPAPAPTPAPSTSHAAPAPSTTAAAPASSTGGGDGWGDADWDEAPPAKSSPKAAATDNWGSWDDSPAPPAAGPRTSRMRKEPSEPKAPKPRGLGAVRKTE